MCLNTIILGSFWIVARGKKERAGCGEEPQEWSNRGARDKSKMGKRVTICLNTQKKEEKKLLGEG